MDKEEQVSTHLSAEARVDGHLRQLPIFDDICIEENPAALSGAKSEMQGNICMPQDLETGSSPPPHNNTDINESSMNLTMSEPKIKTKELQNQSSRSDSGFLSTNNTNHTDNQSESDNRSDCSSPEKTYCCPICNSMLTSQHEFTLHIRCHNDTTEKGYICRICGKILCSSSSLDRHVLIHSGERPFSCNICGDTFTTNGNMHRHMRTHSLKNDYESDSGGSTDGSTASSSQKVEFNNNQIEKHEGVKRKLEEMEEFKNARIKIEVEDIEDQRFKCPVCDRNDFTTVESLKLHLIENHPDHPAECDICKQNFPNIKALNLHRNTVHADQNGKQRNSIIGFKDLTDTDFSSQKFPHIAKIRCEEFLHKSSSADVKYQCQKCPRAFPCATSLQLHEKDCATGINFPTTKMDPSLVRKTEFFNTLDLQDNSPEKIRPDPPMQMEKSLLEIAVKSLDNTKDLADIPSILSMTANGSFMQHLAKSDHSLQNMHLHSAEKTEEEEAQDLFAIEFRKMKLRGEFPCRLCTAVFPNLRALKGHNRTHLNGNNNGTYHCNMCPYSSPDKAALIRHMRNHNGDRPYECSLCKYAFTTKANCERHLRKRHSKTTREEVKNSIIYHPSEDPTNDELNKLAKEDVKKLSNMSFGSSESDTPEKIRSSTPKIMSSEPFPRMNQFSWANQNLPKTPPKPFSIQDIIKNLSESKPMIPMTFPPSSNGIGMMHTSTPQKPKINVKNLETLQQVSLEYESDDRDADKPIDLSTKKSAGSLSNNTDDRSDDDESSEHRETPEDLSNKAPPMMPFNAMFTQQLLQNPNPNLYTQLALMNLPNIPPWAHFSPLFLQAIQNPIMQEQQERLKRQLSGGSVVNMNKEGFPPMHQPMFNYKPEYTPPVIKSAEEIKPLSINVDPNFTENISKIQSPQQPKVSEINHSPNSVKMVIKNGVLMPKQKQRRYRTERPFACEHCSARFTLRSNMERHIKQQHPQYWSQRQRSNSNPGRKPNGAQPISIPNYEPQRSNNPTEDDTKDNQISDKIKYAILAQHLRGGHSAQDYYKSSSSVPSTISTDFKPLTPIVQPKREEDDECALVIDEPVEERMDTEDESLEMERRQRLCLEEKLKELREKTQPKLDVLLQRKNEDGQDLVSVSRLLDNASQQPFKEYFKNERDEHDGDIGSEEDEEGLVASGSTSEANSGTDENKSESDNPSQGPVKKKSAYSLAPNRVSCPYCNRKFPWTSSLRRHILTHTGQKPFKCSHCPLLFTTKSNCDRHLLRKHGNSATTIVNDAANNSSSNNFLIRNVPERPFKCNNCPSSTFSTASNLKKHIHGKHQSNDEKTSHGYDAGSSEDEKQQHDWENHHTLISKGGNDVTNSSDLPFKCHLCDGSFSERNDCLEHIKEKHPSEYDLLMSKNALESNPSPQEDSPNHQNEEDDQENRGKFPDYSNRKVICAFCMRRFWSAEDLRRHMRTHTGERPFSCDICRRRFTLKHSMLRHRKKHNMLNENDGNINSDEDVNPSLEKLKILVKNQTDESDGNESGDLISNLLGIQGSIVDQVLTATADDAAKLLGVKNQDK